MHSIWFNTLSNQGFIGLALFIGLFVVTAANARWLVKRTQNIPGMEWANNFGRMLQAALVGFAVGGSFVNLEMYDGFFAVIMIGAAARRIVAAELAARERVPEVRLAGALPAGAASSVRMGQPLART